MTRIMVLTNLYPPHALGGYEWSCFDVMERLRRRGHEITIVTTTTRLAGVADAPSEAADRVHRVLEWYWDDHVLASPSRWARLTQERRNHRRVDALLSEARPEVVSVWNMGAMSQGLLRSVADRGVPMVYAVCDEWPVYGGHLDAWGRMFAGRPRLARVAEWLLRVPCAPGDLGPSGAWCFVSEHTRQACRNGSPFTFPRSTVVHSGIEPAHFPLFDEQDDPHPFRWRLLHVGRLDERKGVLTAVQALPLLPPEATLRFVGRGDAEGAIRRLAVQLGVSDRITIDSVDRSGVAAAYRGADVFLFTSEWDEPFGLTPIEAMACGTPVVGTGTGGSDGFLIDDVDCVRVPAGNAAALAQAVRRISEDPALRQRLRHGGRRVAAELTTDRLADTFEAWHVAAAAGFPDGSPPDRPLFSGESTW